MKYKVRVSELRYGEVEVDAASEREAKSKATRTGFNFFDSEITGLTAEKMASNEPKDVIERLESWANGDTCDGCPAKDDTVFQAAELLRKAYLEEISPRTYIVTETCPHCESEIEMLWNTDERGFKAFCPVCGKRLMLCDECLHTGKGQCDYSNDTDSCRYNPTAGKKLWMRLGVMLNITDEEAAVIFGEDESLATDTLREIIDTARIRAEGDCYIPMDSVEDYNKTYGTNFETCDTGFDL